MIPKGFRPRVPAVTSELGVCSRARTPSSAVTRRVPQTLKSSHFGISSFWYNVASLTTFVYQFIGFCSNYCWSVANCRSICAKDWFHDLLSQLTCSLDCLDVINEVVQILKPKCTVCKLYVVFWKCHLTGPDRIGNDICTITKCNIFCFILFMCIALPEKKRAVTGAGCPQRALPRARIHHFRKEFRKRWVLTLSFEESFYFIIPLFYRAGNVSANFVFFIFRPRCVRCAA